MSDSPVSLQPTYIKGYKLSYSNDYQYLFIGGGTHIDPTTNKPRIATVVLTRLALKDEVGVWERCI
ncbi:hypothetical protein BT69DRAFT_1280907 [Atractiella rhizophila]|nr:hypothetical protein BT69DRAFT_1280907 [Atractiella rhizophila]